MGPEPAVAREEAEAEPLAGPDWEPIKIAAGDVERSYPGPFLDHVGDAEPVPPRNCSRLPEAEDRQRAECDHVQSDPEEAGDLVGREVHADGQLMQEAERDREVDVQVNGVPGFVRRPTAVSYTH